MKRLLTEESGQSMIEYGLLAALISIAAIAAIKLIGPALTQKFQTVADAIAK
ncbi:MAG TPA: Flp family type IVb pilin [Chroococcales cyanobacterium]